MSAVVADRPAASDAPAADGSVPHRWWWVSGPGIVVGLVSAFVGLDRKGFWLDEAYTLGAVSQLGRTLRETSGTMALYYPFITAWSRVSDSVWWMRSLSVLTAAGALVVVGRLARRLVGDGRARLVVVLTALSPMWLAYAREARSYALVMVLGTLSWLALDHVVATTDPAERRRWATGHTVLVALLPLAHGLALLLVVPQAAVLLAGRADRATWARFGRSLALGVATTGALLAVGAQEVGAHARSLRMLQVGIVLNEMTSPFPVLAALLLVVLAVGAVELVGRARAAVDPVVRARAVLPLAWAVGPVLLLAGLSVVRPSFVTRYVVGIVPALALVLLAALDRAGRAAPAGEPSPTEGNRRLVHGAAVGLLLAALVAGHLRYHHENERDPWRAATQAVATRDHDGDAILLPETSTRPPFEASWRDVADPPALEVVGSPRPLGRVLRFEDGALPEADAWVAAEDAGRLWVVGNPSTGDRFTIDDLTGGDDPSHREVDRWLVDREGLTVVLLVPR